MKFIKPIGKKVEFTEEEKKTIKDCIGIIGELYHETVMQGYENLTFNESYTVHVGSLEAAEDFLEDLLNLTEIF